MFEMTSKGLVYVDQLTYDELRRRKKITQMAMAAQIRVLVQETQYKFPAPIAALASTGRKEARA